MNYLIYLSVFLIFDVLAFSQGEDCSVNVGKLDQRSPIYLNEKSELVKIVDGNLNMIEEQKYRVVCPPTTFLQINGTNTRTRAPTLVCSKYLKNDEPMIIRFSCRPGNIKHLQRSKRGVFIALGFLFGRLLTAVALASTAVVVAVEVEGRRDLPFIPDDDPPNEPVPCILNMVANSPLVLKQMGVNLDYVYPYIQRITMAPEQTYLITCGEEDITEFGRPSGTITCIDGDEITFNGHPTTWSTLACYGGIATPRLIPRHWSRICPGEQYSIGWRYLQQFLPQIDICYSSNLMSPVYTKHTLNKPNFFPRFTGPRAEVFHPEGGEAEIAYYTFNARRMLDVYGIMGQTMTKGHMAVNSDFIYPCQRSATFYYINMLPQWGQINTGSWGSLETFIQRDRSPNDYTIYTGGQGNEMARGQRMTLKQGVKGPVPLYFWKLVYNPVARTAIGFIGLNTLDIQLHRNVSRAFNCYGYCQQTNWPLPDNRQNIGYIFCCSYQRMAEQINIVRNLALNVVGPILYTP